MPNLNSSTSSFKTFFFKFLCPCLIILATAAYVFKIVFEKTIILKTNNGGAYKINKLINEYNPDEIAMFGASEMVQDYIPDILGPNYFNYGLNGVRANAVLFLLKEEVNKKKKTPIIIDFTPDGLNYSYGFVKYYLYNINRHGVADILGDADRFYYHVGIIKYYGYYEPLMKDYLSSKIEFSRYNNKGASIYIKPLLPEKFAALVKERENTVTRFVAYKKLLDQFTTIITHHTDRKFIFVVAPHHVSFFNKYQNEADEKWLIGYLQTYKNVKFFDFSRAKYPDSCFFDTQHLNYTGAARFSKTLKDSIAKL